jgi:hypothetical protein
MSLLRSARRQPPVVVVHPRHPELCLAAPSHASSGSDHGGSALPFPINDHHPHPPHPLEPNSSNNPSTPSRITIREELVFLRQGRPIAAHALPAAASPLPPPLSAPGPNGGRAHPSSSSQPPPPPLLLRSCAPGGRPATSCFCNVTTLYD